MYSHSLYTFTLLKQFLTFNDVEVGTRYIENQIIRENMLKELKENKKEFIEVYEHFVGFFLNLVEQGEQAELELSENQQTKQIIWLGRIQSEHDNLRTAWNWIVENNQIERALRLIYALCSFWIATGFVREGWQWAQTAIGMQGNVDRSIRAKGVNAIGQLAYLTGNYPTALGLYRESLQLYHELGNKPRKAEILYRLGMVSTQQSEYQMAKNWFKESLSLSRELDEKPLIAVNSTALGIIAYKEKDYTQAKILFEEGLILYRLMNNKRRISSTLDAIGSLAIEQKDWRSAQNSFQENLAFYQETNDIHGIVKTLNNLSEINRLQGNYQTAIALQQESLKSAYQINHKLMLIDCLEKLIKLTIAEGNLERAVYLLGAVSSLRKVLGVPIRPHIQEEQDRLVNYLSMRLSEERFTTLWQDSQRWSLDAAITYALQ